MNLLYSLIFLAATTQAATYPCCSPSDAACAGHGNMGCCPSGGDIIISSGCFCTEKQTCFGPATPSPTPVPPPTPAPQPTPAPPPSPPSPTPVWTSSPTHSYDDDDYEGDVAGWVKSVGITLACVLCLCCCCHCCHRAEQWYRYEYIGDLGKPRKKPRKAGKATGGGEAVPPGGYVAYAPLATARAYVPPPATGGGKTSAPPPSAAGEESLSDLAGLSTDALERELARRKAEAV